MDGFRRNHRSLEARQIQALNHPIRLRILEMHRRMKSRPLSLETLTVALTETREYSEVKVAEVKYHRDRLLDADLLPV
jgi:hypothetical protein